MNLIFLLLICFCNDNTSNKTRSACSGNTISSCEDTINCSANELCSSKQICEEPLIPVIDSTLTSDFVAPVHAFDSDIRSNSRKSTREQCNPDNALEPYRRKEIQSGSDVNCMTKSSDRIALTGTSNLHNCEAEYAPEPLNNQQPVPTEGDIRQSHTIQRTGNHSRTNRANRSYIRDFR